MVDLLNSDSKIDTNNFTLIIPSVSVGNVGQLAVDLIISTHNLRKIGTVWHPGIIASVGGDPYTSDSTEVTTACELYADEDLKIAVLQLRSSVEYKLSLRFFNALKEMILKLKFKEVVILTSTFSYELHDVQSNHFRYIGSNGHSILSELNILPLEPTDSGKYSMPGSGFALKLFDILKDVISSIVIVKYASEGDNRPDALAMLDLMHKFIENFQSKNYKVTFPSSWSYVFGNSPPTGIF